MSLREYKRKRDFRKTPEPAGDDSSMGTAQFVIQKHAASRLHYDFRLELDGVLKSWAVPKGPSLNPSVKSLAVQVEDHPIEYASFEGIIPKGEYGGGAVLVWDHGTWAPEGNSAKSLRAGKLKFQLFGEKLRGGWSLVRMSGRAGDDGKNWLLIKQQDKYARPDEKVAVITRKPRSVISDRSIEQIALDADRVRSTNGSANVKNKAATKKALDIARDAAKLTSATKAVQPKSFKPQLATLATEVPQGDRWLHEIKFDGYRILTFFDNGAVTLITRQGKDWTHRFRALAAQFESLPLNYGILDGEIVALNGRGISEFQRLQNSLKRGDEDSLVCYLFDMPYCEHFDLTATPLLERKELLQRLILAKYPKNDWALRYSDHIHGQGDEIWQHACRGAMEGIVSKLADSGYHQARTRDWLKIKCLKRQEFVIAGFTQPTGSRVGFGALLLGYYRDDNLIYCGRVGTGFTRDSLRQLIGELRKRKQNASDFRSTLTTKQRRGVTWAKPELVCEVEFTEWTDDGLLRHPSFQGLREDKPSRQVVREVAGMNNGVSKSSKARVAAWPKRLKSDGSTTVAGVNITHPERIVFADTKITKLDLAQFYERIAEWVLPHVADRPLTLVRCPEGSKGECFYQKHLTDSMSSAVHGVSIKEKEKRDKYVVIKDLAGLISLVQMGVLEFHPWPARADDVERPDRLVFDMDPAEGLAWKAVVQAARDARSLLDAIGLQSFLRTSGGKGLHVVVPLSRRNSWDELKRFAKGVADKMAEAAPDRYIATMSKAKRRGKVFVDYLRNQRGATAVASYSTRARAGAPVATPLGWNALNGNLKPDKYRVANLPRRLDSLVADPWGDFFEIRQTITAKMLTSVS